MTNLCLFVCVVVFFYISCHAPIPGPTRLTDLNRVPGRETIYWDSLPDFFLSRTCTCGYGPHLITESKYHVQYKNYHRSGVHRNLFTYTESHLQIQIRARNLHVVNPYKCIGPGCMRMFADVFSCTYTD